LDIQQGLRDDLRLLIMSATLDNDRLCQRLPDAPTIVSTLRKYIPPYRLGGARVPGGATLSTTCGAFAF
ncbi:ATP-dependent helicase hrpB, partial [Salmonella enterica subsp. enterica serovar Minnesota str. A4-603]